jgi:putative Holliday junction resolvase
VSRVLGVDLGTRRVGLALSDPARIISSPLSTLAMKSESALVGALIRLCKEKEVETVVIGLPVSADGSEGPGCARARRLSGRLIEAGIRSELVDESWSSRDAEQVLREMGKSRRTAREKVDAIAASLILRDYLEGASHSP